MSENMEIWDKVKRPPEDALKTIKAGRLKGMTDVNPQWRIEVMTKIFGPIGIGWYYNVIKETFLDCGDQISVFIDIELFINHNEEWSKPIHGSGGKGLYVKEHSGLHMNDEAKKMAETDALGTAMKKLGVASDIYKGLWDGSKYVMTKEEADKDNKERREAKRLQKAKGDWFDPMLKLDVMALQEAFEASGYTSDKDEKEEMFRELINQVNSYEKLASIKELAKKKHAEVEGSIKQK